MKIIILYNVTKDLFYKFKCNIFKYNNMFMQFKLDKKIFDFFWVKKFFQTEIRLEFEVHVYSNFHTFCL